MVRSFVARVVVFALFVGCGGADPGDQSNRDAGSDAGDRAADGGSVIQPDAGYGDGIRVIRGGANNYVFALDENRDVVAEAMTDEIGDVFLTIDGGPVDVFVKVVREDRVSYRGLVGVEKGGRVDFDEPVRNVPTNLTFFAHLGMALMGDCAFTIFTSGVRSPREINMPGKCLEFGTSMLIGTNRNFFEYAPITVIDGPVPELRAGRWIRPTETVPIEVINTTAPTASEPDLRLRGIHGFALARTMRVTGSTFHVLAPAEGPLWFQVAQARQLEPLPSCPRVSQNFLAGVPLEGGTVATDLDAPIVTDFTAEDGPGRITIDWNVDRDAHSDQRIFLRGEVDGEGRSWTITLPADRKTLTLVEPEASQTGLPSQFDHRELIFHVAASGTTFGDTLFAGYKIVYGRSGCQIEGI